MHTDIHTDNTHRYTHLEQAQPGRYICRIEAATASGNRYSSQSHIFHVAIYCQYEENILMWNKNPDATIQVITPLIYLKGKLKSKFLKIKPWLPSTTYNLIHLSTDSDSFIQLTHDTYLSWQHRPPLRAVAALWWLCEPWFLTSCPPHRSVHPRV